MGQNYDLFMLTVMFKIKLCSVSYNKNIRIRILDAWDNINALSTVSLFPHRALKFD